MTFRACLRAVAEGQSVLKPCCRMAVVTELVGWLMSQWLLTMRGISDESTLEARDKDAKS